MMQACRRSSYFSVFLCTLLSFLRCKRKVRSSFCIAQEFVVHPTIFLTSELLGSAQGSGNASPSGVRTRQSSPLMNDASCTTQFPCLVSVTARTWRLPRFLPSVECGRASSHIGGCCLGTGAGGSAKPGISSPAQPKGRALPQPQGRIVTGDCAKDRRLLLDGASLPQP